MDASLKNMLALFENNPLAIKILGSALMLVITLIIISVTNHLLFKTIKDSNAYYITKKRFYYFFIFLFVSALAIQWSESDIDLSLYIGFISMGVAFALREVFTNAVAWLIILVQKPFEVGDRISVNGHSGDVIDLKLFNIVVIEVANQDYGEQSTGKVAHIPNNFIFLHQVTNASKGFRYIWHEIDVRLSLESDWEKAHTKLLEIVNSHVHHIAEAARIELNEASKNLMLNYANLTPIVYVKVKDSAIVMTARYLCELRKARMTENTIYKDFLLFVKDESDITLV